MATFQLTGTQKEGLMSTVDQEVKVPESGIVPGTNVEPTSATPSVITSSTLTKEPDIELPTPEPSTEVTGELGRLEAQTEQQKDAFTQQLEQQTQQATSAENQSFTELINAQLGAPTREELEATAYATRGGVDEIRSELNDLNSKIIAEQRSLQNKVRQLKKNPQGLFAGALDDAIADAETESLQRQADLAIIQMSVQGRFDSAKEIADRAIDARYAREERKLNALSMIYSRNKELFDTSEQRQFEEAQAKRKREFDKQKADEEQVMDLALNALKNGAPRSVYEQMMAQKKPADAISAGGAYIDANDRAFKELQIANLRSQIAERGRKDDGSNLSATQLTALGYAERTLDSSKIIDEVGNQFTSGLSFGSLLPNMLKTEDRQRYEQAQRNFVNAVLRRESGAAISDQEFDSAREQYFPQRGDSLGVTLQKQQNRNRVIANLLREGGQDATAYVNQYNDPMGLGISENTQDPLGLTTFSNTSTQPVI